VTGLLDVFVQPLTYDFMVRGLVAAVLVGIVCAVVGVYVVLRGMAFFGDALAHAVLPGVALGYLVSGSGRENLFWWALGSAVFVALAIGRISRRAGIKEDTAIGILFASMFALGIALISTVRSYTVDLSHFLFGDVLGVSTHDLLLTAVFGGVVLLAIFLFYKEFLVLSFDPVLAATLRLPASLLNNLLFVLMALTVSVAMQTVGVALMVAMLVTPAATASLLTRRLWAMMLVSAAIGALSAVIGLYLSYYLNIVSGSAIVLTATAIFLLVFLFNPRQGVLRREKRLTTTPIKRGQEGAQKHKGKEKSV
jgi:ABC-type Mn2+/Zn2+ transport system permease subunit